MATQQLPTFSPTPKQTTLKNQKIYQIRQSLIKSKLKTQSQNNPQLPYLTTTKNTTNTQQHKNLLSGSNRHLRYLYHQFCKQSYQGGAHGTFDDIADSAQFMTVNKWMCFCREFMILEKISNREANMIFKLATNQKQHMNIDQFVTALELVKEKGKINQQEFVKDFLHVDSYVSARNRLGVMKINFSGPKSNFFIQSTLTQKQRVQQKKQQKIFKQKQRQLILHQGMFAQHIEHSLLQRKHAREQKKQQIRNKSMNTNRDYTQKLDNIIPSNVSYTSRNKQPYIMVSPSISNKSKSVFSTYSKIFSNKRSTNPVINNSSLLSPINDKNIPIQQKQSKSRILYQQRKLNGPCNNQQPQLIQNDQNDPKWEINSSTESDQILRYHYENQKKLKSNSKEKLPPLQDSRIAPKQQTNQQDIKITVHLDKQHQLPSNNEDDNQDDMMITRYN